MEEYKGKRTMLSQLHSLAWQSLEHSAKQLKRTLINHAWDSIELSGNLSFLCDEEDILAFYIPHKADSRIQKSVS